MLQWLPYSLEDWADAPIQWLATFPFVRKFAVSPKVTSSKVLPLCLPAVFTFCSLCCRWLEPNTIVSAAITVAHEQLDPPKWGKHGKLKGSGLEIYRQQMPTRRRLYHRFTSHWPKRHRAGTFPPILGGGVWASLARRARQESHASSPGEVLVGRRRRTAGAWGGGTRPPGWHWPAVGCLGQKKLKLCNPNIEKHFAMTA